MQFYIGETQWATAVVLFPLSFASPDVWVSSGWISMVRMSVYSQLTDVLYVLKIVLEPPMIDGEVVAYIGDVQQAEPASPFLYSPPLETSYSYTSGSKQMKKVYLNLGFVRAAGKHSSSLLSYGYHN